MLTAWGYEVEELPPLVGVDEYNALTGGSWSSDPRLEAALDAAGAAVRSVCGWHVAPSLQCTAHVTAEGRQLALPARFVTAIEKVVDDGTELAEGQYEASRNGLVRRCGFTRFTTKWDGVEAVYTAGLDLDAVPDLADIVCRIVDAAMSVPVGVTSEAAGNVSISYSAEASAIAANAARAYADALAPYKLVRSHAV
jgi:hypothetical protein